MVLVEIAQFLLDITVSFLVFCLFFRLLMQRARVRPADGLGQFCVVTTNWLVLPLRRVLSGWAGVDWGCWVALFLLGFVGQFFAFLLFQTVSTASVSLLAAVPALLWRTLVFLVQQGVYFLIVLVLANVVLSWVAPFSPLRAILGPLLEPFLAPIRRILPKASNFDFSPLLLIVGLQVVLIVLKSI